MGALTTNRSLASWAVCVFAAVALAAGCVDGGVRRSRLEPTVGVDARVPMEVAPPYVCAGGVAALNCAAPFLLPASGHVTDFSMREWSSGGGKWCNEGGMHGAIFSFKGNGAGDSNAISVNTDDASLRLSLSVSSGSYGGGGVAFEAGCVDASAFTGVQFSVAIASGSLTGCTYQLQLQTFEQRPISQAPSGGCDINTTSCYSFPAATNLAAPSPDVTMPTVVAIPFDSFGASVMPAPAQIVGLQWQVNSSSGACTVELRLDDIAFIPAAAPPEPSASDAGT
jgi:hypothetical protein